MDMEAVLFRRMLVRRYEDKADEENNRMAEELFVTKEANGYACWYQGCYPSRIIAWAYKGGQYDIIAYAATLSVKQARHAAYNGLVHFDVPRLDAQAVDYVPEKE